MTLTSASLGGLLFTIYHQTTQNRLIQSPLSVNSFSKMPSLTRIIFSLAILSQRQENNFSIISMISLDKNYII